MSNDTPGAGWHTDPLDAASERYWDGWSWTHETRPTENPGYTLASEPSGSDALSEPPSGPRLDEPGRSSRIPVLVVAAAVLVAVGAAGFVFLGGSDAGGERLYVQDRPDRSGAVHHLAAGEDLDANNEIVDEADWIYSLRTRDLSSQATGGSDVTFLEYAEEGSNSSDFGMMRNGEFVELIRLRDENVTVELADDGKIYVISTWSNSDTGSSCFVGSDLENLVEIRSEGGCISSDDGSVFLTTEWDDGITRYAVVDREDNEILRGESQEYPVLSSDGKILATVNGGARDELEMWDLATGQQLAADTRAEDITISGLVGDRAVVNAWDSATGRADVLVVARDGTETELTSADSRYSQVLPEAGIVAVRDSGRTTIFSVRTGEELGNFRADWEHLAAAGDGRWMAFAVADNGVDVYWADGASAPTEIASHRMESPQPTWVYFGDGSAGAYSIESWDGSRSEAVLARVSGASDATVLEEDVPLSPAWISPDASEMLALGFDNGTELTLVRAGQRSEVLDDEDSISDVQVRNGTAYFTARRDGDSEVRSVRLSPDDRPQTLFEDAALVTIDDAEQHGTLIWMQGE